MRAWPRSAAVGSPASAPLSPTRSATGGAGRGGLIRIPHLWILRFHGFYRFLKFSSALKLYLTLQDHKMPTNLMFQISPCEYLRLRRKRAVLWTGRLEGFALTAGASTLPGRMYLLSCLFVLPSASWLPGDRREAEVALTLPALSGI